MTGPRPENPLDQVFTCPGRTTIAKSHIAKEELKKCVDDLETALTKMQREVVEKSAQLRAKKRAQKDPFRRTPNFQLGDYVLIGIPEPTVAGKKLFLKWRGPYCITDTKNNYIFLKLKI